MTAKIKTLHDYAAAAGIREIPAFFSSLGLFPGTNRSLYEHQIGDLAHLVKHLPRPKLFNEPGTGKTNPAQALTLLLKGWGNKTVWLVPSAMVEQFTRAFSTNFGPGLDNYASIEHLGLDTARRRKQLARFEAGEWPDVLVTSYALFTGKTTVLREVRKRGQDGKPRTVKVRSTEPLYQGGEVTPENFSWAALKARGYTFCGLDEAQNAKNADTNLWRALNRFVGDDGGMLPMTATPLDTNLEDAYGVIALCDRTAYGSKRAFDRKHVILDPDARKRVGERLLPYRKVVAYQNQALLHKNLYAGARRILKKDVLDMPPKVVTELQLTLSPPHRKIYDKLVEERMLEIGERLVDATEATALYQATQRILLNPDSYAEKPIRPNVLLDTIDALVDGLGGRKVLVYAWYRESVEALARHLHALNPVTLYGGTAPADRDRNRMKFIQDPDCRALIANFKSGGAGVDGLQEVCSHAIYAEVCPWGGAFFQSTDRLWRSGQKEAVNIYLLVPRNTVAVALRNSLVKKDAMANEVMRDSRAVLADLMGRQGLQGELT